MLNYELKSSPLEFFYKDLLYNIAFHCNNRINDYYEKLLLVFKGLYPTRDLSLVIINSFMSSIVYKITSYSIPCKLRFVVNECSQL